MVEQITESEWNNEWAKSGFLRQLCQMPYSINEIENKFKLSFTEYTEDGLGICFDTYIRISFQLYRLVGFHDKEDKSHSVVVQVKSFEKDLKALLNNVCKEFETSIENLAWAMSLDDL